MTIDAMGCQRAIAQQIIDQKAHDVLAVKDNQPTLHQKITTLLDEAILENFAGISHGYDQQSNQGSPGGRHGRIEKRQVWVSDQVQWLGKELVSQWPGLASVAVVQSTRQDLGDLSGKVSVERRYYISSHRTIDATLLAGAIRGHWGVENALHWRLDVSMNEDPCRLRVKHGAENFSRLRRIAMNKLKRWEPEKDNGKPLKMSLKLKRQSCNWSRKFLIDALLA